MKGTFLNICIADRQAPFISAVYGPMYDEMWAALNDIISGEDELALNIPDQVPNNAVALLYVTVWYSSETRYGSGYGDVLKIPGHWDLVPVSPLQYETMDVR